MSELETTMRRFSDTTAALHLQQKQLNLLAGRVRDLSITCLISIGLTLSLLGMFTVQVVFGR